MFCLLRPGLRWPRIFFCLLELLLMLSDQFFAAGVASVALGLLVVVYSSYASRRPPSPDSESVKEASLESPLVEGLDRSLWIVTGVPEHRSCRRELATVRELAQFNLCASDWAPARANVDKKLVTVGPSRSGDRGKATQVLIVGNHPRSPVARTEMKIQRSRFHEMSVSMAVKGFDESARSYRIGFAVVFSRRASLVASAGDLPPSRKTDAMNGGRDDFASGGSFGWKLYRRQIEFLTIAVVWTQICASHLVGCFVNRLACLALRVLDRQNIKGGAAGVRFNPKKRFSVLRQNRTEYSFGSLVNELEPGNCHTHRPKKGERTGRSAPANKWRSLNRIAPGRTLAKARGEKVKLELVHEHVI
ncbi:hypothetical protein DFH08DRAFT_807299 [Mycena albidolilacea]|uniref:Uncharacterized protein n=1 Tax=Mycena albidolilacea TaxID=1033008 RepID=A0AAD7ESS3_9AGAR|nr:hypothetical protein DFH08DRAFT_807299 [Mycena albidolilacea]